MKIAIYGAGAIGGYLAAMLARTDAEVACIARGPHLAAMQHNGLTLITAEGSTTCQITATEDPASLGIQDFVIISLKAHSIPAITTAIQPLLGPQTAVVFAVNGVPWWYFHAMQGPLAGSRIESVDPGGVIWDAISPERAIGCVVYPAAEMEAPGVIRHIAGDRFSLGEPDGSRTPRLEQLAAIFRDSGLKAPVRPRIRDEIWVKLWGNCSLNPISALTGATVEQMCQDSTTRAIIHAIMTETQAVAEALGTRFAITVEKRIAGAEAVGAHKTSMLQDLERGRPMEIDALVAAVAELGRLTGIATPTLDMILGLVRQRARLAGCY